MDATLGQASSPGIPPLTLRRTLSHLFSRCTHPVGDGALSFFSLCVFFQVSVQNPKEEGDEPPKTFTLDNVYDWDSTQRAVYDETAYPLVESVMEGYNGTIFAYGQTGTGKTHTMQGQNEPPEMRGIIPNSFVHIFDKISGDSSKTFLVRASYLEIYNEEIRDLLGKDPRAKLDLKEKDGSVYVKDLTSFVVRSVSEIDHVMNVGQKNRSVGSTLMNQESSRSHSIFTITVETSQEDPTNPKKPKIRQGKLNLVDLAGSERQGKTGATGDRLKEATKINLSLSALGNCISALVDGRSSHIPYRDSKLTRLLQDSLGGNTKTVMFATVGPADYNYDETISTCRYANRAKNIKNKPKINEDPKDTMIREFQDEIARLKAQLEGTGWDGDDGEEEGDESHGGGELENSERIIQEEIVEQKRIVEKMTGASEEKLREMQGKNEVEKQQMQEEIDRMAREKQEMEEKIRQNQEELQAKANQREELNSMLETMQKKLLQGEEQHAVEQEEAAKLAADIRRREIENEERRKQEERLKEELLQKEEDRDLVQEQYSSLKEEEEVKTKKLKKLMTKLKAAQAEKRDLFGEFQSEKEAMHETIRDLERQLKYSDLLLDSFVPDDFLMKIEEVACWEDIQNEWVISHIDYAGNRMNDQQAKPQGLAEAMGVSVDPQAADGYNPYDMGDNDGYAGEFASVGGDMQALVQGEGVRSAFLSYTGNPEDAEDRDEDPTGGVPPKRDSKSRPKSGAGTRAKSASGRRPGSAKKKNRDSSEVLQGLDHNPSEDQDKIAMVPQARGLVSKRPPSAKARPKAQAK